MRQQLAELVNQIREARSLGRPDSEPLGKAAELVPDADIDNLCDSDYPVDVVVDYCLGWQQTQVRLTRAEMINLVRLILSEPASTEADDLLRIEQFMYNCSHPAGADLIYYPEPYFDGRNNPSPEEIVDLAMQEES